MSVVTSYLHGQTKHRRWKLFRLAQGIYPSQLANGPIAATNHSVFQTVHLCRVAQNTNTSSHRNFPLTSKKLWQSAFTKRLKQPLLTFSWRMPGLMKTSSWKNRARWHLQGSWMVGLVKVNGEREARKGAKIRLNAVQNSKGPFKNSGRF